jgi:hypothetical protein
MAKKNVKNQVEETELDLDLELDDELELDEDLDLDLEEGEEEVEVDDADDVELELDDEDEEEESEEESDEDDSEEEEESEDEDEEVELEDEDIDLDDEDEEESEEDEEDIDLDDEEEEEEVKPAKKATTKAPAKKDAKKPAAKSGKETAKATGKTKSKPAKVPTRKSYEDLFEEVTDKTEAYDAAMEERQNGSTVIPPSVIISKDLLLGLLSAKSSEDNTYLKTMIAKIMIKMGYDKEEVQEEVKKYNFAKTDVEPVLGLVTDVLYEVLEAGAGFAMFKTEDCNFSMRGVWVDEKISENKHLNTTKDSKIESYLAIKTKSPAPKNKKTLGKVVKGKFVADTAETKPAKKEKAAPAKKGKSKKK